MLHVYPGRFVYCLLIFWGLTAHAQPDCNYEDRRAEYLEQALQTASGGDLLVLQAFNDLPLDQAALDGILLSVLTTETADFRITSLIRVLFLTDGEYDDQILPVLNSVPYWLPDPTGPDRQYWSENHMVMWMSADWLLHEKYGRDIRPTLRQMLVKWLDMKIEYGFYEYFSPIYYPFTMSAMMNLTAFSEDEEIRSKAEQAASRMLHDVLLMVNDEGYYFPTCGRGDMGKFNTGYIGGVGALARLVTGIGGTPTGSSNGAVALATTEFDATPFCTAWTPEINTTIHYGHPLSEARNIYSGLPAQDRIIFQWSSGAYFHPLVAQETMWQIGNFQLWGHEEFEPFAFAQFLPASLGPVFANVAASITRSSYIGEAEIDIFRSGGVILNSSQDKWKGRAGYQIYPVIATVENTPVLLRSGEVYPGWDGVPNRRSNDHLPYVDQDGNVALVMYKPNADLEIWGFGNKEVALKWDSPAFDEERAFDNWQLGRIGESYIAVRKHCDEYISGIPACPDADGQTWAIIVGNADMHGSFDEFEAMVHEAVYEERWYFNWQQFRWYYYGHIIADGKDIDHHWKGNWWDAPDLTNGRIAGIDGRFAQPESNGVEIYPNPAGDQFTLDLHAYGQAARSVSIINADGQVVYQAQMPESGFAPKVIRSSDWAGGMYTIVIGNEDGSRNVKRLVIGR